MARLVPLQSTRISGDGKAAADCEILEFTEVCKSFGPPGNRVAALRSTDFSMVRGQMCAIMGPSGSGKSTMLHLAAGLIRPDSGRVVVAGQDLAELNDDELTIRRRRIVGVVFQFFELLPYLTASQNVGLPLEADGMSKAQVNERTEYALELVGLSSKASRKPHELSGGEMQRVAIARALSIEPEIILADEPTGNLDTTGGRHIINLLRDLNEQLKTSMLIVTHNAGWAAHCDRVVHLIDGRVHDDIPLQEID